MIHEKCKVVIPNGLISSDERIDISYLDIEIVSPCDLKLDAIFIPTIKSPHEICVWASFFTSICKNVILLTSTETPEFSSEFIEVICMRYDIHIFVLDCLPSSANPSIKFQTNYDIPTKRNLAMSISKRRGYKYIALIDDDITITMADLLKAIYLLSIDGGVVGFYSLQYPDISTIDAVESILTQEPAMVCLSGNCLFLNLDKVGGYFPYVYNEDWHFIEQNMFLSKVYGAGIVTQKTHEPWKDLSRTKFEQFGDIIGYGMYEDKTRNESFVSTDKNFWQGIFCEYLERLNALKRMAINQNLFVDTIEQAIATTDTFSHNDILNFLTLVKEEINQKTYEKICYKELTR